MNDEDTFPNIFDEVDSNPEEFEAKKLELKERCKAAGIKYEDTESFLDETLWLTVKMPAGRQTGKLIVADAAEANALLSFEFEKYHMLGDYTGIYSYEDGTIEASIRSVGASAFPRFNLYHRLFENDDVDEDTVSPIVLEQTGSDEPLTISLGNPSAHLQAFDQVKSWRTKLSIQIFDSKAQTHEKVLRLLERLTNALFFQIDLKMHIPLTLQRERSMPQLPYGNRSKGKRKDIKFPSREYEAQPMSLYWYGRSATGMPLLQFLAYYQVLEFYMPTYSNHDAIAKVRNVIKDPRFDLDKDSQVARILASLRPTSRGYGDERSQLEAVLRSCIQSEELREFYKSTKSRMEFYENDSKAIALQKIPLRSSSSDLLTETTRRLYEIRCRIVHTKDHTDHDLQPLLPYSKETAELHFDIALIEFVAISVLVASSMTITT